jgi:hypothetical protein
MGETVIIPPADSPDKGSESEVRPVMLFARAARRYTLDMATVEHTMTAEQLFHAIELGRCELVRGEPIIMSPAGSRHGAIAARIGHILWDFVKPRNLGVILKATDTLTGDDILPGLEIPVAGLFA